MDLLTPEQLQQLSELGLLDDQEGMVKQQLARAQSIQAQPRRQYADGISAAIGGLGSLIGDYRGRQQERGAMDQLQGIQQKRQAGRALALNLANQPDAAPAPEQAPPYYVQRPGTADPRDAVGLPTPDPQQSAQSAGSVLLNSIKRKQQLAQNFALSGDPVVSKLGQSMLTQAGQEQSRADAEKEHALDRSIRSEAEKRQETRDAEAARHQRVEEGKDQWQAFQSPHTGEVFKVNRRTGETVKVSTGPILPSGGGQVNRSRESALMKEGEAPPGFEDAPDYVADVRSGKRQPHAHDLVKKANEVAAAAGSIFELSVPVLSFLDQHPNGIPSGTDATQVEPYIQGIQSMARQANEMGVYRAYDKPLLDKIVRDPTEWKSILSSATGYRDLRKQFEAFLDETGTRATALQHQAGRKPTADGPYARYSVKAMGPRGAAGARTAPPAAHPQDAEAVQWANDNLTSADPKLVAKAKLILAANGAQ